MRRARNDPAQYDDLATAWWDPSGPFAALHWLAEARAALVPPPSDDRALLLDLGCGGGLMAPLVRGYRHVGLDISARSLMQAAAHGVVPVRGDASRLPFADACADVVLAGELLEHVPDLPGVVGEVARVLRPGGLVVLDTINDTRWARLSLVTVGERLPGGPPPRIHDPRLFVAPRRLAELFGDHGIPLRFRGLRVSAPGYLRFLLADRGRPAKMVPTRSLTAVYQALGRKPAAGAQRAPEDEGRGGTEGGGPV